MIGYRKTFIYHDLYNI